MRLLTYAALRLKLRAPPRGAQGGAARHAPKAGSHAAGRQRTTAASLIDSGALRLSSAVTLDDVAQDNFRELHNQLLEMRNLLLAAPQFALVICHLRCFRVAAIAVFHDGCRTIGSASPSERQGMTSPYDVRVGNPSDEYLTPAGCAPTNTVRNERTISFSGRTKISLE